jgi:prepilin-type processing-associated H-X9-DG protein
LPAFDSFLDHRAVFSSQLDHREVSGGDRSIPFERPTMKTCPACAEQIPANVETCPHCGISVHDYTAGGGPSGKKTSTVMIVLIIGAGLLVVVVVCGGVLTALLLPAVQQAREAARRSQCKNNLKQIGLALHNYNETYGCLPPAYIADENGKPMHSWRVLILPFLDASPLYNQYDFSEPWDGPNNSRLLARMPPVYACPSHPNAGSFTTNYAGVFGKNCVFRGAEPITFASVTDGLSNTVMIAEAANANIPWMKPEDVDVTVHPSLGDRAGFSSDHAGGVQVLMCDGAVRFITISIDPALLKALYTKDGGDVVRDF